MALCQASLTSPASCHPSSHASFLSTKTAQPFSLFVRQRPRFHRPPVAHALAAPALVPLPQILGNQSSKLADVLGSISSLYSEVDKESRAADEYMQRTAEESGRLIEDYQRRALLYKQSGEMVASSRLKRERVIMELELLQEEVLKHDEGQTAADFLMRAQLFSKSAEVFCKPVL